MTIFPQSSEAPQVDRGGVSTAPSRSVQTLEPSSVSQSPFLSLDGAHARQELGLSSRFGRVRSRRGLRLNLILGALASAAAVAMLIALCAAAYLGVAPLHLTRRRLSEGSVPQSTAGLVACGETSGNGSGDDPQASSLKKEVELPPAKKAKAEEEDSDAGDEADSQAQTSVTGQAESTTAAGAAVGAAAAPPEAHSPLERRVSPEEALAAEALIALSARRAAASCSIAASAASSRSAAASCGGTPARACAAATATDPQVIPSVRAGASIPAGVEGPQPQPAPVQLAAPRPGRPPEVPPQAAFSLSRLILLSSHEGLEVIDFSGDWEPPSAWIGAPKHCLLCSQSGAE
ncbi:hypothetical protein Esti_006606 [Eimeria stiedai]